MIRSHQGLTIWLRIHLKVTTAHSKEGHGISVSDNPVTKLNVEDAVRLREETEAINNCKVETLFLLDMANLLSVPLVFDIKKRKKDGLEYFATHI